MINPKLFYRYLRVWFLPLFFLLAGAAAFFYWAENQINVPGGLRDIEYWETAMASTNVAADLMPLSGYLHQCTAEIMVEPKRNQEGFLIFAFMNHVFQKSEPLRKIPDLKYALMVYKRQLSLAAPSSLKLYFSIRHYLGVNKKQVNLEQDLISESNLRLEKLIHLESAEKTEDMQTVRALYEKALSSPEFSSFQAPLMLRLAFFFYERDPAEARKWIGHLKKNNPRPEVRYAAAYLRNKLNRKVVLGKGRFKSPESEIKNLLRMGLFDRAAKQSADNKSLLSSSGMEEMNGWLGLKNKAILNEKQTLLPIYFNILKEAFQDPTAASNQLVELATDNNFAAISALLRYQAWSVAYFDAKNYSRAFFITEFLRLRDPLSPYSQLDEIKGMFRPAAKKITGSKLLQVWQNEPYRFDMTHKSTWEGFKEGKQRQSEMRVHKGRVYFIKYNDAGQAEQLQEVNAGEHVSTEKEFEEKNLKEPVKMGWVDRFFYGMMIKVIPLGVQTFKQQIWKPAQKLKAPIFTRLYKQDEFQTYVIDKMRPAFGPMAQSVQTEISEEGFSVYAVFNLKLVNAAVYGLGKLLANNDGRLILKLDHVKVGKFYLPKWLLRKVEKSFNLSANSEESSESSQIDILDMQYQKGGILIQCRKK